MEYTDKQRDENVLSNLGRETVRIVCDKKDYRDIIENTKLSKMFDLSEIDWGLCEEFSISNEIKNVSTNDHRKRMELTKEETKNVNI